MELHQKIAQDLFEADKLIKSADHLTFVTMPVVKDAKLLARALENVHKSLILIISSILKFEYLYKRIVLSKDHDRNLQIFYGKCAARYGLNELDVGLIKEVFFLGKKHKESGFEFSKFGKVIILDDKYGVYELDGKKMQTFLALARKLLANTNSAFLSL